MKLFKIFVCVISAYSLISCGGAEERKSVYFEKAEISFDSGDLEKARIEIKNVVQIDPKDSNAIYFLGKVYEAQKDFRKAFSHYQRAEELNPDNLINKAKLGSLYLIFSNEDSEVQQRIDYILAKDPENPDGLLLKAAKLLKSKKNDEAKSIAEGIVSKNPGHNDSVRFLASVYVNENKTNKAITILEKASSLNSSNEQLNKLLALAYVKNKDYDRAEVLYKSFIERHPDSAASYNNLAAFYNQTGEAAKAEQYLQQSIDNDPSDVERHLTLIKFVKTVKGNGDALTLLKNMIKEYSGLGDLRMAYGELLLLDGKKDEAIKVHKKTIQDFHEEGTDVDARIALASIYIKDEEFTKASIIIEDAILISPSDPKVNLLRAKLAIRDKDLETAIISLRIVTKEMPDNVRAFLLLAGIYQLEKNEEQVKDTLNNAYINNKTNPDALFLLSQYHMSRDIDQAEKIIDDYNNIKEADYKGMSIKSSILNQKKKQSEAFELAKKMVDLFPSDPNGYLQQIPYYSQQGDKEKAISVLETGYLSTKDNRKLLILLTTLQVSDKKYKISTNRIKAELKSAPEDYELKVLLAKVHLAKDENETAISIIEDVIADKPSMEEPYLILSQVYQLNKNIDKTEAILIKGKANVPASFKIPLRLAAINEVNGKYSTVIDIYRELYEKNPENLIVINNLASTISDHSDSQEDLKFAETIIGKIKDSGQPVFLDTVGWLYYKLGDHKNAVDYLQQVVDKSPEINVFNYHLGMAYKLAGNNVKAKSYLEKSLDDGKSFKQMGDAKAALGEI